MSKWAECYDRSKHSELWRSLLEEMTSKLSPESEENLKRMVCSENPKFYTVEVSLSVRGEGREIAPER